jgi:hypothetical protein
MWCNAWQCSWYLMNGTIFTHVVTQKNQTYSHHEATKSYLVPNPSSTACSQMLSKSCLHFFGKGLSWSMFQTGRSVLALVWLNSSLPPLPEDHPCMSFQGWSMKVSLLLSSLSAVFSLPWGIHIVLWKWTTILNPGWQDMSKVRPSSVF